MRPIDADALLDKAQDYGEGQRRLMLIDPYWVRKAPTIERPRGEWISLDDNLCGLQRFKCSNCGHQIFCEPSKLIQYKGCYCGASMRKMRKEGESE